MKIKLITPAPPHSRNGNRITAVRWAGILKKLGHRITVHQRYDGTSCDLLIALHARRSYESIHHFRERDPNAPLIVVLTGTDLYRDIRTNRKAQRSLRLATRLIVLQKQGLEELPPELRRKTRVIYQSAEPVNGRLSPQTGKEFKVCVIGHLRPEKDPFRTARASRLLPSSSQIQLLHVGEALTKEMKDQARKESRHNDRYRWLGKLTHGKTRHVLARSHLLSLTSKMEGSSNVLSEAIASSVPVLASKIAGLIGTLGRDYPGYFPTGDTRALARLLLRAERDEKFYRQLKSRCARLAPLVHPRGERESWKKILRELS